MLPPVTLRRPMRLLVIGAGSIGTRHLTVATAAGWSTAVVRRPSSASRPRPTLPAATEVYESVDAAILAFKPDAAIVATPTALHLDVADALAKRAIPTLIEKPLATDSAEAERFAERHSKAVLGVACNLRFWPPVSRMRDELKSVGRVLSVRVQAGQHLSQWRPGTDYKKSYSALPELGGGALLDLIHEIDYMVWTLGLPQSVSADVVSGDSLGIASEALVVATMRWQSGPLGELHLDYLRHQSRRAFEVIGTDATIAFDTDRRQLERWTNGPTAEVLYAGSPDDLAVTYQAQLDNLRKVTEGKEAFRTSLDDGVRALRLADAIRTAAKTRAAVTL